MTEDQFWMHVRISTPYGKYHSAHITSMGMDYNEESRLDEGEHVAKERLFKRLKELGHITEDLAKISRQQRAEYLEMKNQSMNIEHNGLD